MFGYTSQRYHRCHSRLTRLGKGSSLQQADKYLDSKLLRCHVDTYRCIVITPRNTTIETARFRRSFVIASTHSESFIGRTTYVSNQVNDTNFVRIRKVRVG